MSRLDSTFSSRPNYLLYFVYNPLKHSIDTSAIDTTLVFKVLVLLAFIERKKKCPTVIPRVFKLSKTMLIEY